MTSAETTIESKGDEAADRAEAGRAERGAQEPAARMAVHRVVCRRRRGRGRGGGALVFDFLEICHAPTTPMSASRRRW